MSATFKKGTRYLFVTTHVVNEPELPPIGRQAINFGKAMIRNAVSVTRGNPLHVSEATRDARRVICEGCAYRRPSDGRCGKCGCPTSVRGLVQSKTELFAESCPVKLWGRGEITSTP